MSFWWYPTLFLGSVVLTGLIRFLALRIELLDIPNGRSSHTIPTPRGGGVAIIITFFLGGLPLLFAGAVSEPMFYGACVCGGMIALVGIVDDYKSLSPALRFMVHTIAAIAVCYVVPVPPLIPFAVDRPDLAWLAYILMVLGLVWFVNLFNFMDGIDGIAGGQVVTVGAGAAFILWLNRGDSGDIQWLLVLVLAGLGFLCWNRPPAKIFMGDGGSGFLGFMFGYLALFTAAEGRINHWSWLILQGVFLVDASVTLLRRIWRGERFYQAHRSHAYQILSRRYQSHAKVTMGVIVINIVWLTPLAALAAHYTHFSHLITAVAISPLIVFAFSVGAGKSEEPVIAHEK